jgi:hypothetical protein
MGKFDPDAKAVMDSTGLVQGILVSSRDTVRSESVYVGNGEYYSVAAKSDSGGIIDVTVNFEQSHDEENWEKPINCGFSLNLVNTDYSITRLDPVPAPYIRFKLEGNDSNGASTRVNIWLSKQVN